MESLFRGFELWNDAGGVVGAELLVADAAGPGAHGVGGRFEADGAETGWVVRTHGGGDEVEEGGARGANAERALGADEGGAEVEGVAAGTACWSAVHENLRARGEGEVRWNEARFHRNELLDQLGEGLAVDGG